jgi:hypothetical protein
VPRAAYVRHVSRVTAIDAMFEGSPLARAHQGRAPPCSPRRRKVGGAPVRTGDCGIAFLPDAVVEVVPLDGTNSHEPSSSRNWG